MSIVFSELRKIKNPNSRRFQIMKFTCAGIASQELDAVTLGNAKKKRISLKHKFLIPSVQSLLCHRVSHGRAPKNHQRYCFLTSLECYNSQGIQGGTRHRWPRAKRRGCNGSNLRCGTCRQYLLQLNTLFVTPTRTLR